MTSAVAVTGQYSDTPKLGGAAPSNCHNILSGVVGRSYAPKQDVFYEGDPRRCVYQIEAGAVCLYKCMPDGRRQILDFAFPGDLIGLGASAVYSCGAQAIGSAQLKSMPLSRLYDLASKDPGLALSLYHEISSELEAMRGLLLTLGQRDATERVAVFLLTLSQRNVRAGKNPCLLTIPMTRSDIGDLLGTTIETVSRNLTRLRQQRLIDVIRGSIIQILDMDGLKALAGETNYH
jgi:CRP/FNR family transcriptional regulator